MRIVVLGGTGSLGRAIVAAGNAAGHTMVAASRHGEVHVDVATGSGLDQAFRDADVVMDATNAREDAHRVLVEGTARVLDAANTAGVRHFVGISIVGIDDAPLPYYRTKVAQEKVIEASPVPWTLLRATQFHDLIPRLAPRKLGLVLAPLGFRIQPIHVREVASMLVEAAGAGPQKRLTDVGGPAVRDFVDLMRAFKRASHAKGFILPTPVPAARGAFLRSGALCCPDRAVGTISFEQWLAEVYGNRAEVR
jgi:uncharacterized protein YbjT (DUF2867 family)